MFAWSNNLLVLIPSIPTVSLSWVRTGVQLLGLFPASSLPDSGVLAYKYIYKVFGFFLVSFYFSSETLPWEPSCEVCSIQMLQWIIQILPTCQASHRPASAQDLKT